MPNDAVLEASRGRSSGVVRRLRRLFDAFLKAPHKPRFVLAQLVSRLGLDLRAVTFWTPDGTRLRLHNQNITLGIWRGTYHDDAAVAFLRQYLKDGDTAVDVGANIGHLTVVMAQRVGPTGQVLAVEANTACCRCVAENAQLNTVQNIRIENVALADEDQVVREFHVPVRNSGEAGLSRKSSLRNYRTLRVLCRRAEALVTEVFPAGPLALFKIDVEGAELEVLRGMGSVLDRVGCVFFEYSAENYAATGSSTEEVIAFFHQVGFQVFEYDPRGRKLTPFSPASSGEMRDLVATRDVDAVLARAGYTLLAHA